jgi:hypothetical protein
MFPGVPGVVAVRAGLFGVLELPTVWPVELLAVSLLVHGCHSASSATTMIAFRRLEAPDLIRGAPHQQTTSSRHLKTSNSLHYICQSGPDNCLRHLAPVNCRIC